MTNNKIYICLCVLFLTFSFCSCQDSKEMIAFYHCGEVMFYNQYTVDKMLKDYNRTPVDDTVHIKQAHIERLIHALSFSSKRISHPDSINFSPTLYFKTDTAEYFLDDMRNNCLRVKDKSHTYLKVDAKVLFLAKLISGYYRYAETDSVNESWLRGHGYTDVLKAFYSSHRTIADEEEEKECAKILIIGD